MDINIDDITILEEPIYAKKDDVVLESENSKAFISFDEFEWKPMVINVNHTQNNNHKISWQLNEQVAFFEQNNGNDYKFDLNTHDWIIYDAYITNIVYPSFDMEVYEDDTYITLTLRYEKAEEKQKKT